MSRKIKQASSQHKSLEAQHKQQSLKGPYAFLSAFIRILVINMKSAVTWYLLGLFEQGRDILIIRRIL